VDQSGREPVNNQTLRCNVLSSVFMRCTACGKEWNDGEEFLCDQEVFLDGRQASALRWFVDLKVRGLLMFVHNSSACGSRLVLAAEKFHAKDADVLGRRI
jgi:hypothetical protein